MTEDDARKKWCPFSRVIEWGTSMDVPSAAGVNRTVADNPETRAGTLCIASDCMAWRVETLHQRLTLHPLGQPPPEGQESMAERHGYCGLAGREGAQ